MDQRQQSSLWPTRRQVAWIAVGVVVLFVVIVVVGGYYFEWKWTGYPKRKPWDWLDLLIVPVVLAIVGFVFTSSENRATRVAAEQRAQDEALQAYLDQLGQMLLDGEKPLRESKEGDEVRTLAPARALTVLNRLDGRRKATVVQFLYESGLIGRLESPKSMGSMTKDPSPAGGAAGQRGGRDGLERNRAHDRGSEVRFRSQISNSPATSPPFLARGASTTPGPAATTRSSARPAKMGR